MIETILNLSLFFFFWSLENLIKGTLLGITFGIIARGGLLIWSKFDV